MSPQYHEPRRVDSCLKQNNKIELSPYPKKVSFNKNRRFVRNEAPKKVSSSSSVSLPDEDSNAYDLDLWKDQLPNLSTMSSASRREFIK